LFWEHWMMNRGGGRDKRGESILKMKDVQPKQNLILSKESTPTKNVVTTVDMTTIPV
jgi:hypothetical protein